MPGNQSRRDVLFVSPRNPAQEHWTGRVLTANDARQRSGIATVLTTSEFEPFVTGMLGRREYGDVSRTEAARFFAALEAGRARFNIALDPDRPADAPVPPPLAFARRMRERFVGFDIADAASTLTELRLVKTSYERTLLVKSAEISVAAELAGLSAARAGAHEYEVKAAVEAVHRGRGAVSAYPSIVASGPNATVLHYEQSDRQMQAGELLLVDAGASFGSMSTDVTRTYPVSGSFSPAQRDLYELVLDAQAEGIKVATAGRPLRAVYDKTAEVIRNGLLKLGLITDTTGDQYRIWYTHGSSHYIGIDVHDAGDKARALEAGMAFTIEPGIYVRQSALDALPRTPENLAFIARVQPAVAKYLDIGVRIEDSFLVEESGVRNLTDALPRSVTEIQSLMQGRP